MADPTVITPQQPELGRLQKWMPDGNGIEATRLLNIKLHGNSGAISNVRASAVDVLSKSNPPGRMGDETGLVVGYVQSGKTLSFTTVTAMARDNGYQLVIVVAGSSIQLSEQSRYRIRDDLGITPDRPRTWALFPNPRVDQAGNIQRILDEWQDVHMPDTTRQTVLITVMKQHNNLRHVTQLLDNLNLTGVSALLIDDEADQASLNNEISQGSQSTTYRRLLELRSRLQSHTLLQYTATPQAPLLINIIDTISPNFVEVLEPGTAYTGGQQFFQQRRELLRTIPQNDVPTRSNPLTSPPESLLEALRIFLIGVAAGLYLENGAGNRSMLVHPSHLTAQQLEFYTWITDIFEEWRRILQMPDNDADKLELISDFQDAYNDLNQTVPDLPAFDVLLPYIYPAFNRTNIEEVNRRRGKAVIIDWGQQYGWILVGGQAMDRGYTIEGLTVTYMPRGIGVGNADTIQQRARFFGYKGSYLGYCRVYLERQTCDAFTSYVEHEEFMRTQLSNVMQKGESLNDWKRAFVLDPSLKPCRDSVIEFDYVRDLMTDGWYAPEIVLSDSATISFNRSLCTEFIKNISLSEDPGDERRTEIQRHMWSQDVSLRDVVTNLITQYKVHDPIDSQKLIGLLVQLGIALDDDRDEPCTIYQMSSGLVRERSVDIDGKISNLFQGAAPVAPKELRGSIYPGDRLIRAPDAVTIQLHNLRLLQEGNVLAEDVAILAIRMPSRLARPWLVQQQPTQNNV